MPDSYIAHTYAGYENKVKANLCVYTAGYAPAWKNSDTLKEHFKEVLKKRETNLSINFKHEKQ